MSKIRALPCEACPYRRDVPSGVWAYHEYEKLREYDAPTQEQPFSTFACHASPAAYCHGWAVVHSNRGHAYELVGLRIWPADGPMPQEIIPLFTSGNEAADHGQRDIEDKSEEAMAAVDRLLEKHPRLREGEGHGGMDDGRN